MCHRLVTWQDTNVSVSLAASSLISIALKMVAARFSETLVPYHITTRRHNSQHHDLIFIAIKPSNLTHFKVLYSGILLEGLRKSSNIL